MKVEFVRKVVKSRTWSLVWDLGCNIGIFSKIAAENARYVIAMDADHLTIDLLYTKLKSEGNKSILPLTVNVGNISPNHG